MKLRCFLHGILSLLCLSMAAAQPVRVQVKNPSPFPRPGELVAVRVGDIAARSPRFAPANAVVVREDGARRVTSQLAGDELLFLADLDAGGERTFIVRDDSVAGTQPPGLVDGRYVLPRGDYAWENDRIAFRMYGSVLAGDVRNGVDVWTKRVRSLIVAKWYKESEGSLPGKDTYHVDRGEGADFFSVGRSLGAGGSAVWKVGRVHQPGVFSKWRTLANGPLRVSFELTYDSVIVDGVRYSELRRITLDAGQNLCAVTVTYTGPRDREPLQYAAGLVKRKDTRVVWNEQEGWMSLWGPTNADSVNGDLGTAVLLPRGESAEAGEDSAQHLLIGSGMTGVPHTYFAGAGWTRSGDFVTEADWLAYLSRFAEMKTHPVQVTITDTKR